jgi:hypothetical protein
MEKLTEHLAYVKKALVNVATLVLALGALPVLPAPYDKWVAVALAVAGAVLHYTVSNGPKPSDYQLADAPAVDDEELEPGPEDYTAVGAQMNPADPGQPAAGTPPPAP